MDAKKIGLIVLLVVGVVAAFLSFRRAFMSGPAPVGQDQAAVYRERMQEGYRQQGQQGPMGRSPSPAPTPGR